jgi:hypothetical protein
VTAAAAVAAVATLSKINAAGRWIDRSEHVDLNSLFDKMTRTELEEYAVSGQLPNWFERTVAGTAMIAELEREGGKPVERPGRPRMTTRPRRSGKRRKQGYFVP